MREESYSPPHSHGNPMIGFMQDLEPCNDAVPGSCCNETTASPSPSKHPALDDLIRRVDLTRLQIQTFRDSLPERLGGIARQGFKCLTHTTLEDIDHDLITLANIQDWLTELRGSLPKVLSARASLGLEVLINDYRFRLSRDWAFPN